MGEVTESDVWVQIVKDPESGMPVILQGTKTTIADAIGLLHYALMAYEEQYKLKLEYDNIYDLKNMMDSLNRLAGQVNQSVKAAESTMVRMAALNQNIKKGM